MRQNRVSCRHLITTILIGFHVCGATATASAHVTVDVGTDSSFTAREVRSAVGGRILSSTGVAYGGIVALNPDVDAEDIHLFHLTENTFDRTVRWPQGGDERSKSSHPTASEDGQISFMSSRGGSGYRIYVMNGDGTGQRPLTNADGLSSPTQQHDSYPVISPDGSRVAFISNREEVEHPNGYTWRPWNLYVVKTDGTGLQRLSDTEHNTGGGPTGSQYYSVDWSPDGSRLAYLAFRPVVMNGNVQWRRVLGTVRPDGTNDAIVLDAPDCAGGKVLDWSPNGRHILLSFGGFVQGCFNTYYLIYDMDTGAASSISHEQLGSSVCTSGGCARFSPDGATIGFTGVEHNFLRFIGIDGSDLRIREVPIVRGEPLWWSALPAIGEPTSLALGIDTIRVAGGERIQLDPVLRDASGNVLSRMASTWSAAGRLDTPVSITGELYGIEEEQQATLCAHNAGLTDCVVVINEMRSTVATESEVDHPQRVILHGNYPNPFNPETTIRFDLPQSVNVTITVYDGMGREVTRLLNAHMHAGPHGVLWDASALPSGVYYYRLQAGIFSQSRAMSLLR